MSRILDMQVELALATADLILQAHEWDWKVTFGATYRSPEEAQKCADEGTGIVNSLHCDRLAVDLNFFYRGQYVTESGRLKIFGDYWKKKGAAYRWGGDFKSRPDGNHFSITPDGVRA